jgi:hypothetical protein
MSQGGTVAAGTPGKVRKPLNVLLLMIVTLGIYALVWYYKTFDELKRSRGEGLGGVLGLVLALFCSIIVIFLLPAEVAGLYEGAGREAPISALTGLWVLLPIVGGIVWLFKVQGRLNDFWTSVGA